jgi:AcrR family transcriptional regulator
MNAIKTVKTRRSENRKQEILDCAKIIFARKGFYETQIIDIVHELKIGKGTPYQYFENKEELFLSLIESIYASWRAYNKQQPFDASSATPAEYFRWKLNNIIFFFHNDPDSAKIFLRMGPGINRSIEPFVSRIEQQFVDEIKKGLKKGIELGVIERDSNMELLTNVIFGTTTRVAYYYIARSDAGITRRKLEDIADATADMLIKLIYKKEYWS